MVLYGDRAKRRQRRSEREHALGQIRVQPHALDVGRRQCAAFVPHRVRHPEPADVMHQAGAPQRGDVTCRNPAAVAGLGRQLGHAARMPDRPRGLQVAEIPDRLERRVELLT
jgi:hypothetical protein